jgi:phospholipid transport system substrate-binding protein
MSRHHYIRHLFVVLVTLMLVGHVAVATAGEPQDKIRQTIESVLAILRDDALRAPDRTQERRDKIRQAVVSRFGFEEMAKRAMGRHWRKLTSAQQKEFVSVFSDLLEHSYISKIEAAGSSSDFEVLYTKETVEDNGYAMVRTEFVNKRDLNAVVEYRMLQRNDDWEVYDIVIEGVSLVNNYRTQFNQIIHQESFESLMQKMKTKIAQETAVQ